MNIGDSIRTLRKAAGLTQEELAEKVGVSRPAITQIERGKVYPAGKTQDAICAALGIAPVVLYLLSLEREDIPARNRKAFDLMYPSIKAMLMQLFA